MFTFQNPFELREEGRGYLNSAIRAADMLNESGNFETVVMTRALKLIFLEQPGESFTASGLITQQQRLEN
jgi:hypothetical protein